MVPEKDVKFTSRNLLKAMFVALLVLCFCCAFHAETCLAKDSTSSSSSVSPGETHLENCPTYELTSDYETCDDGYYHCLLCSDGYIYFTNLTSFEEHFLSRHGQPSTWTLSQDYYSCPIHANDFFTQDEYHAHVNTDNAKYTTANIVVALAIIAVLLFVYFASMYYLARNYGDPASLGREDIWPRQMMVFYQTLVATTILAIGVLNGLHEVYAYSSSSSGSPAISSVLLVITLGLLCQVPCYIVGRLLVKAGGALAKRFDEKHGPLPSPDSTEQAARRDRRRSMISAALAVVASFPLAYFVLVAEAASRGFSFYI